jgi:hypothetical protein
VVSPLQNNPGQHIFPPQAHTFGFDSMVQQPPSEAHACARSFCGVITRPWMELVGLIEVKFNPVGWSDPAHVELMPTVNDAMARVATAITIAFARGE